MMLRVSAREKLPCMPWPCCRPVSATSTPQVVGSAQPSENVRKLTAMAGIGVTAVPWSAIAESGNVPGSWPRLSSTNRPLT